MGPNGWLRTHGPRTRGRVLPKARPTPQNHTPRLIPLPRSSCPIDRPSSSRYPLPPRGTILAQSVPIADDLDVSSRYAELHSSVWGRRIVSHNGVHTGGSEGARLPGRKETVLSPLGDDSRRAIFSDQAGDDDGVRLTAQGGTSAPTQPSRRWHPPLMPALLTNKKNFFFKEKEKNLRPQLKKAFHAVPASPLPTRLGHEVQYVCFSGF